MSLDQPNEFVKHQAVTRDAFLGGRLTLSQPAKGFRAGLDSVLLGAAIRPGTKRLLDMGAGVGTAGLVALSLGLAGEALLAERDPATLQLTQDNIEANDFATRAKAVLADVTAKGSARIEAGLVNDHFDAIIANPPFFDVNDGTLAGDATRADARHMAAEALDLWVKTAAGCAAPGGEIIFVYPSTGLAPLLAAFSQRFGAISVLPLLPRPGEAASRVLIRAIKGSRAPLSLLAGRALHGEDGRGFAPRFDAIFRGTARLDW
jgi:tRNA1(Val) A37 N6-methylase TrmN6